MYGPLCYPLCVCVCVCVHADIFVLVCVRVCVCFVFSQIKSDHNDNCSKNAFKHMDFGKLIGVITLQPLLKFR